MTAREPRNARAWRLEDGRCAGVETEDGERYLARTAVLSTIHVKRLVEMAPAERPFRTVVSPPLVPLLAPYNDMAESHRTIVAGIFGVSHLVGAGAKG